MRHRLFLPLVALCFFFSGTAALLYEVVWLRLLGLAFGHRCRRSSESPGTRSDLQTLGLEPQDVLTHFVLSSEDARWHSSGALFNTDDLPLLEFAAPRALY